MQISLFQKILWMPVKGKDVPKWVQNATAKFIDRYTSKTGHRPYDITITLKGRTFKYQVFFKTVAQGIISPQVSKKRI